MGILRFGAHEDPVLDRANLERIKEFILERGEVCFYCNMFNRSPYLETAGFRFILDPDPGGPDNHPQWNSSCDPDKGDFHSLYVTPLRDRRSEFPIDLRVRFFDVDTIEMEFQSKEPMPPTKVRALARLAVQDALDRLRAGS